MVVCLILVALPIAQMQVARLSAMMMLKLRFSFQSICLGQQMITGRDAKRTSVAADIARSKDQQPLRSSCDA